MAVYQIDSWNSEWNDILRQIIFPDADLKALMLLPANTTIIDFEDKYFIKTNSSDETLTDENVRIIYSNYKVSDIGNPHVVRSEISFDIYVKKIHVHDVGDDRLTQRGDCICFRLRQLLSGRISTSKGPTAYKLDYLGSTELRSTTIGYRRYNITFAYNHT